MAVNQHVRDKNGVNDYKKGNRTDSHRNPDAMVKASKESAKVREAYEKMALARRQRDKYGQEQIGGIWQRICSYIQETVEAEQPLTINGLILATGMDKNSYYRAVNGEYDFKLEEYITYNNIDIDTIDDEVDGFPCFTDGKGKRILLIPYREMFEKVHLKLAEMAEIRLYKQGRVADIFTMKSQHGWQDNDSPQTVNQTLVIASKEEARRAINLLK